jgi:hypothetical protein
MRGNLPRSSIPSLDGNTSMYNPQWMGKNLKNRDNPQPTWLPNLLVVARRFNARQGVGVSFDTSKVRATPTREGAIIYRLAQVEKWLSNHDCWYHGTGLWQPSVHSDVAF